MEEEQLNVMTGGMTDGNQLEQKEGSDEKYNNITASESVENEISEDLLNAESILENNSDECVKEKNYNEIKYNINVEEPILKEVVDQAEKFVSEFNENNQENSSGSYLIQEPSEISDKEEVDKTEVIMRDEVVKLLEVVVTEEVESDLSKSAAGSEEIQRGHQLVVEFAETSDPKVEINLSINRVHNSVDDQISLAKHSSSFAQLMDYTSDEEVDEENTENPKLPVRTELKRSFFEIQSDDSSDSEQDSSDSSVSSVISPNSSDDEGKEEEEKVLIVKAPVKTKNELTVADLPPIETLRVTVPKEDCLPLGIVHSIVDTMVVMKSAQGTPPLNLDSIVFTKDGKALGKIFDVFGPVTRPFYVIRFNSNKEIKEKGLAVNDIIYCAPQTEYTSYVFTAQLMKEKGSDASWFDNNEPPAECLDYSDDEQEMEAKKKLRQLRAANKINTESPDTPSKKKLSSDKRNKGQRNSKQFENNVPRDTDVGWHRPLRRPRSINPSSPQRSSCPLQPNSYPVHTTPPLSHHQLPFLNVPPPGYAPQHFQPELGALPPPTRAPFCSNFRPPPILSQPPPAAPHHGRTRSAPPLHRFGQPPQFQQPPPYHQVFPSPPYHQPHPSAEYF